MNRYFSPADRDRWWNGLLREPDPPPDDRPSWHTRMADLLPLGSPGGPRRRLPETSILRDEPEHEVNLYGITENGAVQRGVREPGAGGVAEKAGEERRLSTMSAGAGGVVGGGVAVIVKVLGGG